jgi:small neutral amino acid transporter SnatA (MarC family)
MLFSFATTASLPQNSASMKPVVALKGALVLLTTIMLARLAGSIDNLLGRGGTWYLYHT